MGQDVVTDAIVAFKIDPTKSGFSDGDFNFQKITSYMQRGFRKIAKNHANHGNTHLPQCLQRN